MENIYSQHQLPWTQDHLPLPAILWPCRCLQCNECLGIFPLHLGYEMLWNLSVTTGLLHLVFHMSGYGMFWPLTCKLLPECAHLGANKMGSLLEVLLLVRSTRILTRQQHIYATIYAIGGSIILSPVPLSLSQFAQCIPMIRDFGMSQPSANSLHSDTRRPYSTYFNINLPKNCPSWKVSEHQLPMPCAEYTAIN